MQCDECGGHDVEEHVGFDEDSVLYWHICEDCGAIVGKGRRTRNEGS